jgi:hypothetical protein
MRTAWRTNLSIVHIFATAATGVLGCSGAPNAGEQTRSEGQELFLNLSSGSTLWSGGVVPVCYSASDGNNPPLLAEAQDILNNHGWPVVANVQYTGWQQCGSSAAAGGQVRLHFVACTPNAKNVCTNRNGDGRTSIFGQQPGFNDVYLLNDDGGGVHFRYEVLHEFGHVLGWAHEQTREDNYGPGGNQVYCVDTSGGGEATGGSFETSYFDTQSVMSYCAGWPQELSPGDVAGIQRVYPPTGNVPNRGIVGANNTVSRTPNSLDNFFVHNDGSVWTSYWNAGMPSGSWPTFQLPGNGSGSAPENAPIAAVSRGPLNIDLFYAGNDSSVHTSYWNTTDPAHGWGTTASPHSYVIPGTAGLVAPGEQIAAVSSSPGAIDVLFAGTNGDLYWTHWSGQCSSGTACGWSTPSVLDYGSVPYGADVTAVAPTADRLDAFYIGNDGVPHTAYCYGFGTTGTYSCTSGSFGVGVLPSVSGCAANPGGSIVATARTGNNIDIFYPNTNNGVCTNYWSSSSGWQVFQNVSNAGSGPIGRLVALTFNSMDLNIFWEAGPCFYDGNSCDANKINTAYWAGANTNWNWVTGTIGYAGSAGGFVYSAMGSAARTSNNADLFVQTGLGQRTSGLETMYWSSGHSWQSWEPDTY